MRAHGSGNCNAPTLLASFPPLPEYPPPCSLCLTVLPLCPPLTQPTLTPTHRFHWPSVYTGSVAPPVNGSSNGQVSEPVYWFVDLLAPFQVGRSVGFVPHVRHFCFYDRAAL